MRRTVALILPLLMLFLSGLSLTSCSTKRGASVAPTAAPTATNAYWGLVQQAQTAFTQANYAQALALARQAAGINPDDNTSWEIYRQASIAVAADDYLTHLPDQRYQLPVDVFIRDRVDHSKEWFIVDVRTPDEFAAGHIDGALNAPLDQFMHHLDALPSSKSASILVYCHTQKRATHALVILHELGYIKAYNLEGGYAAYEDWLSHNPTPGPTPTPEPEQPDFGC